MASLLPFHRRLARSERGVAMVEFAMVLPLLLLLFAIIVEGGRMMWSYQTAIAGVRDAARYISRVVDTNECPGRSVYPLPNDPNDPDDTRRDALRDKIVQSIADFQGDPEDPDDENVSLYPNADAAVIASLDCSKGGVGEFRVDPVPVVIVSAQFRIDFPFQGIFAFAADGFPSFLVTTITDQSRVFGS